MAERGKIVRSDNISSGHCSVNISSSDHPTGILGCTPVMILRAAVIVGKKEVLSAECALN